MLFEFELGNSVWAKAKIPPTRAVNLWLGADLMVEYPIDEAQQLLVRFQPLSEASGVSRHVGNWRHRHSAHAQETNLKNCKANMATTEKDLLTIRGFKTTTEVRVCNALFAIEAAVYASDSGVRREAITWTL